MKEYGGDEDALLAELQFAFIAFLVIKKSAIWYFPNALICIYLNNEKLGHIYVLS